MREQTGQVQVRQANQAGQPEQVEILMATYNGEKFVAAQIESILAQDYRHILLTIFDDGSTDGTLRQIEQYLSNSQVRIVGSERVGLPRVYFRLLGFLSPASQYAGYADQDDVWLPGKVSRSLRLLRAVRETVTDPLPMLYCSRSCIADEQLRVTGTTMLPRYPPSFPNALVQGIAAGSTMLFNKGAAGLLASWTPQFAPMHDWWTYLVISATGRVVYDPLPTLLYRQHGANARGIMQNGRWSWRKRALWHFQEGARSSTRQATELREWLGDGKHLQSNGAHSDALGPRTAPTPLSILSPAVSAELDSFLDSQHDLPARMRYALSGTAHRQRKVDDIVYRALYLLGRI